MKDWSLHIAPRVHLVGGGMMSFRLSHALDCNVWLLDGGDEWTLIDAGSGVEVERIIAAIEGCLRRSNATGKLKTLILTHAHGDHAAGANALREAFGLQVMCAAEAAPWLERGDMEKNSLRLAMAAGAPYPEGFTMPPCPIARALHENDVVRIGDIALRVLETPGHSRGHISLWCEEERALFSGDLVFARGKVVLQNIWDCSIPEHAASLEKINAMRVEQLFAGHGAPLLTGAHEDIAAAHRKFAQLGIAPNLNS